jgi:hypothetical protein
MNQERLCLRIPRRLIYQPSSPCGWPSCAAGNAHLLDMCHVIYVWGDVDREVSDLRQ